MAYRTKACVTVLAQQRNCVLSHKRLRNGCCCPLRACKLSACWGVACTVHACPHLASGFGLRQYALLRLAPAPYQSEGVRTVLLSPCARGVRWKAQPLGATLGGYTWGLHTGATLGGLHVGATHGGYTWELHFGATLGGRLRPRRRTFTLIRKCG
eukprot:9475176-Pyramimonas_sp.AAC.1